jgi:RNA polymerase sigma-70 factor (ECF subfamily)
MSPGKSKQDALYQEAMKLYGGALARLVRAYEADADKRLDLLQEIHFALWRSFQQYEERCSLRTWVYRVAHNTSASHVMSQKRKNLHALVGLEEIEATPDPANTHDETEHRLAVDRLLQLIQQLKPLDREIMLLYLEDMDGASIAEITGISPGNVRIQIHRIKSILEKRFHGGSE